MAVLTSKLILSLVDRVSGPARGVAASLGALDRRMTAARGFTGGMMGRLVALGAGYVGVTQGIRGTVGAAISFEAAFADVRKVVDATDEQFDNMRTTIKNMSRELPITANDIAALYAAAGEAGIATGDLKAFSLMASRVGIAFDMSAGQAGESLAKLKTQLGLSVEETGLMADAINHLSNNMASKASDITAYMLRVGKFAEMGGFHRDQIAAIGSAMIASGAEAETAGTAMMNVVRKMTTGSFAKKDQREAAKALGLDLPTLAKQMQKDAPKALKTVLKAIAKAPKENQIALLSKFFGDEARAFAPLVGNIELLDQALGSVANRADYAGSAYKEYVARASTTANVLQILRNKIAFVMEGLGEKMLPTIRAAAQGIGDVLDTLDQRIGIFDKIGASFKGFMDGFGGEGGMRAAMGRFGDMIFGPIADGSKAADDMGLLFMRFREWGASVREFSDSVGNSKVGTFMIELAAAIGVLAVSKWGQLFIVAWGIKALIEAVSGAESIGEFVEALKGLSALEWVGIGAGLLWLSGHVAKLIALFRTLKDVMPKGGTKLPTRPITPTPTTTPTGTGAGAAGGAASAAGIGVVAAGFMAAIAAASLNLGQSELLMSDEDKKRRDYLNERIRLRFADPDQSHDEERERDRSIDNWAPAPQKGGMHDAMGNMPDTAAPAAPLPEAGWLRRFLFGAAAEPGFNLREHMRIQTAPGGPGPQSSLQDPIGALRTTILQTRASGITDVNITNPPPPPPRPNMNINVTVNNTQGDPGAIGAAVGSAVASQVEAALNDGGV